MKEYIAHRKEDGHIQLLKDHLTGVAELAAEFASAFSAEDHAKQAGFLHDAGKYSLLGQKRMMDPEHTAKVDHSTAGAKIALDKIGDSVVAAVVAGHHAGLMNIGSRKFSSEGDGTLYGRCRKTLEGPMGYEAFFEEMRDVSLRPMYPEWLRSVRIPFTLQFYIRMLFSCLVDADFLDTELFLQEEQAMLRTVEFSTDENEKKVLEYIAPWLARQETLLNRKRTEILQKCLDSAEQPAGLFSLTVPTGGGKTVSSLAFATAHARKNHLKRIIYVIPYTSIIEQNSAVFRKILGEEAVLEHHSQADYLSEDDLGDIMTARRLLATENWDAPVIVTTAVQFFDSLFSNRPSTCRKLHNIADSVIIFDEAQMLPVNVLRPCVHAIGELVRHYHVSAVLCTATQPSLEQLFHEYDHSLQIREIYEEHYESESVFKRVQYENRGCMSPDAVAKEMKDLDQVLCIVNRRKTAQELYDLLPADSRFHLSTMMTAEHRMKKITEIKRRLKAGEPCHVVSTSLIEAGVDIDFPQVWREIAGLDSVIQAGGRCNREGKRPLHKSVVYLFSLGGKPPLNMEFNIKATEMVLEEYQDISSKEAIKRYFDILLRMLRDNIDQKKIMTMCEKMEFENIARSFQVIDQTMQTVYIPNEENEKDILDLCEGRVSRKLLRRLGKHAVNLYQWEWEQLRIDGKLKLLSESSAVLTDNSAYSPERGIILQQNSGDGIWI